MSDTSTPPQPLIQFAPVFPEDVFDETTPPRLEYIIRLSEDYVAILYATQVYNYESCIKGEQALGDIKYVEEYQIRNSEGEIKPLYLEFGSQIAILEQPFLTDMKAKTGTPEAIQELNHKLKTICPWRMASHVYQAAFTSMKKLVLETKARGPKVNSSSSSTIIDSINIPSYLGIKELPVDTGYNQNEEQILIETLKTTNAVLQGFEALAKEYRSMDIVTFGQRVNRALLLIEPYTPYEGADTYLTTPDFTDKKPAAKR